MPLRNNRFAACGDSTLVAISVAPARPEVVRAPVADGKKLLLTWPFWATMKNVKTGALPAAQADRLGKLSRNGSPMATVPAPVRKARRLRGRRFMAFCLGFTLHLRHGS